jgi:LDH2 family malate/lactate/ureidoglycolate dehydrogenase
MQIEKLNYSAKELENFSKKVFLYMGLSEKNAELATKVLITADLRGIDSHGIARLSGYYRLWKKNRINSQAIPKIIHESFSTATVDGDAGLGLIVAPYAMQIAIDKANQYGSGWVSVKNSTHFGVAAYHAMMALEHDMIGIVMTNASPLVAPTNSIERMLGTNPMCYMFPAKNFPPIVIDMATSTAANGKLEIAQRTNKKVPFGWLQTANGGASNDANELKKGGSLLPLGSTKENGSHKGFGLSAAVDIFSAVLSGANFGPWVPPFVAFLEPDPNPVGEGIGHFFGAMRIDGFRKKEDYFNSIDTWIERFKNAKPIDENQPVIIPGEPEFEAEKIRQKEGITLNENVYEDLMMLSAETGIELSIKN